MSKRTHARVNPPKTALDTELLMERLADIDPTDPAAIPMAQQVHAIVATGGAMAEVTPLRNRAERRALIRALTRRRPDGTPAHREGPVPRMR